jgi:hypothetical protein
MTTFSMTERSKAGFSAGKFGVDIFTPFPPFGVLRLFCPRREAVFEKRKSVSTLWKRERYAFQTLYFLGLSASLLAIRCCFRIPFEKLIAIKPFCEFYNCIHESDITDDMKINFFHFGRLDFVDI